MGQIRNLPTHPKAFVKVRDLAEYWDVSPQMLYKQIKAGTLQADRIGPRLYRIRVSRARQFATQARIAGPLVPAEKTRSTKKRIA